MRKHLRYLFIISVILVLSVLMLPGISATRRPVAPGRTNPPASSNHEPMRLGRFLVASLLMADEGFADMGVIKTASAEQVFAGSDVTYKIEVLNGGPEIAVDATLTDELPAGMTFVSLSKPDSWQCTTPDVGDNGTVSCTNLTLPAGSDDFFTLVVHIPAQTQPGTFFNNTAVVSTVTPDANDENNSYPAGTAVATLETDMGVAKTASAEQISPGANLTYTIEVRNAGREAAADGELTDTLPGNSTFVSLSGPGTWSCTTPAVGDEGTVSCKRASVPSGSVETFTLVVNIPSGSAAGTTYTNTATVTTSSTDINTENDSSTVSTDVASADISVSKAGTPDPVITGNNLTYTITVNNAGPSPSSSVLMTDTLPAGTAFVSLSAPGGWNCSTPAVGSGGSVSCSTPIIDPGSSVFTLVAQVSSSVPGGTVLSNTATVLSSTPDPVTGNESSTATTTVLSPATLSGTKTVSGQFAPGGSVTYNVVLNNTGIRTQGDNPGNEFVDVLPTGLTLVSASASSGAATANPATNTVTWNGTIESGRSVAITIQATVKTGTAGTTISNQGNISYDADGNGTNESSSLTDDPSVAGGNNQTSFTVQNAPTISAVSVTRTAGSAPSNSTIANVNDAEDAENTLSVTVNNSSSATTNGVTISNLAVNAAGVVTADVAAACDATNANFTLKVTDSSGLSNTAPLSVTVNTNPAPALTYSSPQKVTPGGSLTLNPATGPSDNSSVSSIVVQSQGTYTGTISVNNSTGVVSLSNAAPTGTHTITIRVTDNCGTTTDASFTLSVGSGLQLNSQSYSVGEEEGRATITVTRSGDTSGAAAVDYKTSDLSGLNNCDVNTGDASARCDYTAVGGTLLFAAGEASQTFTIPVINDVFVEGPETLTITLSNPSGAVLGPNTAATLTISDNDSTPGAANPIDQNSFFIRQLYLDFLNREPDPPGLSAWLQILNNCPAGDTRCDRVEVASAFFRSPESFDRSYFLYKFYEGSLSRQPQYDEYQSDLRRLTGFLTAEELEQRKREFAEEFVNRAEFRSIYDSFGSGQPFVDAVLSRAGQARPGVGAATVTTSNRVSVINRLGAGQITRGQALRELMESAEISQRFYNKAFVVVGYFAFLRRNPDAAYLHWIEVLNTTGDYREMIRGFSQSPEFRSRFGPM
ncbi:MAG TPA: DUF4214 domain-containing protein [Pyrinomonadaceae bacterium]